MCQRGTVCGAVVAGVGGNLGIVEILQKKYLYFGDFGSTGHRMTG